MLDRTRFEHEIAALQYDVAPLAKPATTCYLPIARNKLLAGKMTGVYVPAAARSATTLDVIVYFHGFIDTQCHADPARFEKEGIEYYWNDALFKHLRPELEASGRAALLVAPTLHPLVGFSGSGHDRHGDLHGKHKFDELIEDVFKRLRAKGAIDASADVGNIVLAAHSGGGMPMHAILGATNKLGAKIRACWGFECLYFGTSNFNGWLKANARARFRHFRRKTHFKAQAAALATRTNFIDVAGTIGHCDLVKEHWRKLLDTLPPVAGDAKASFELELDAGREYETVNDIAAVAPHCVAEGFDLIAKARSLDGPKIEQTRSAAPYMAEARKYFEPLRAAYAKLAPGLGFGLRVARDRKEHELGRTFIGHAIDTLDIVQFKTWRGATVGGYWDMLDTTMKGARYFFEMAADEGLSKELGDAPTYRPALLPNNKLRLRPCEIRAVGWLRRHRRSFDEYAKKFRVTALASAGAIAWEALENPMFFVLRAVGPGKPHTRTSPLPYVGTDDTLAKQIETAGYLPKQNVFDRERLLKTPRGAIEYVTAMMGAAADLAEKEGFSIRNDPAVLTAFYQAYDLNTWKAHLAKKRQKGEATFQAIDSMAKWTAAKLPMLKLALGQKA